MTLPRSPVLPLLLLALAAAGACSPPAADGPDAGDAPEAATTAADPVAEVLAFRQEHMTAFTDRRDMDRIIGHFTEDATYLPPGSGPLAGREAIRAYLEAAFSEALHGVEFDNHQALVDGDLAVLRDTYQVVEIPRSGAHRQYSGEDVWVLRRIDGRWRIASVIWTLHGADAAPEAGA